MFGNPDDQGDDIDLSVPPPMAGGSVPGHLSPIDPQVGDPRYPFTVIGGLYDLGADDEHQPPQPPRDHRARGRQLW